MAHLKGTEYIDGHEAAVCENSLGETYYLFTGERILSNGERSVIYYWQKQKNGYDSQDKACTVPRGFSLVETSNERMPVLKKD